MTRWPTVTLPSRIIRTIFLSAGTLDRQRRLYGTIISFVRGAGWRGWPLCLCFTTKLRRWNTPWKLSYLQNSLTFEELKTFFARYLWRCSYFSMRCWPPWRSPDVFTCLGQIVGHINEYFDIQLTGLMQELLSNDPSTPFKSLKRITRRSENWFWGPLM